MSAAQYEPGTVAVATVRGVGKEVVVFRREREGGNDWSSIRAVCGWFAHEDRDVTDVRPLVVLDPEDSAQVTRLLDAYVRPFDNFVTPQRIAIMQDALRAQTRPRKPPEPTSLGAVVKDRQGVRWVRAGNDGTPGKDPWRGVDGDHIGWWSKYNAIDAVEVLSPGVTP